MNKSYPTALAAALALLAALPAQADRGDRNDRHWQRDRGDRHWGGDRGDRHWRAPVAPPHWQWRPAVRHGYVPPARYYPRHGIVIRERPAFWTLVTLGAVSYIVANGVYYREHVSGGYEVVAPPAADLPSAYVAPGYAAPVNDRLYVYPSQGQSADRQASDEYDCHRWAVQQTGFDPSGVAAGTARNPSAEQRAGYPRARNACLEGRGYSVR